MSSPSAPIQRSRSSAPSPPSVDSRPRTSSSVPVHFSQNAGPPTENRAMPAGWSASTFTPSQKPACPSSSGVCLPYRITPPGITLSTVRITCEKRTPRSPSSSPDPLVGDHPPLPTFPQAISNLSATNFANLTNLANAYMPPAGYSSNSPNSCNSCNS